MKVRGDFNGLLNTCWRLPDRIANDLHAFCGITRRQLAWGATTLQWIELGQFFWTHETPPEPFKYLSIATVVVLGAGTPANVLISYLNPVFAEGPNATYRNHMWLILLLVWIPLTILTPNHWHRTQLFGDLAMVLLSTKPGDNNGLPFIQRTWAHLKARRLDLATVSA